MKKIVYIVVVFLFVSCTNNQKDVKTEKITQNEIEIKEVETEELLKDDNVEVNYSFLQGVWTENLEDNSVFIIEGDSITYTENLNKTYSYRIQEDTLIIEYDDWSYKGIIKELKGNILVLQDLEDMSQLKLIKVQE